MSNLSEFEIRDEGCRGECEIDPKAVTPVECAELEFKTLLNIYEDTAPTMCKILNALYGTEDMILEEDRDMAVEGDNIDEDNESRGDVERDDNLYHSLLEDIEFNLSWDTRGKWITENDIQAAGISAPRKPSWPRLKRNKISITTVVISIVMFGKLRWTNAMQVSV